MRRMFSALVMMTTLGVPFAVPANAIAGEREVNATVTSRTTIRIGATSLDEYHLQLREPRAGFVAERLRSPPNPPHFSIACKIKPSAAHETAACERNGSATIPRERRDRRFGCRRGLRTASSAATAYAASVACQTSVVHRHRVLHGQNHGSRDESQRGRRGGRSSRLATWHGDQIGGPGRSIQRNIHGHGHWTERTRPSPRSVSSRLRRGRAVRPPIRPSVDRAMTAVFLPN